MTTIQETVTRLERTFTALEPAKRESLEKALQIDMGEYIGYQSIQAKAHAAGKLPTATAQFIFATLGSGPTDFNNRSLAARYFVVMAIKTILEAQ